MADIELPQWFQDLLETAEEAREDFVEDCEEFIDTMADGWNYWSEQFNEAVNSYNEHLAVVEALESKKESLETFKSYLTTYKDTIGELHLEFASMDSICFCYTAGLFRTDVDENLNDGFGPDHLYNLGIAHMNSHDDLIALVNADIDALATEISDERWSMDWFSNVIEDIREDARAAGFSL